MSGSVTSFSITEKVSDCKVDFVVTYLDSFKNWLETRDRAVSTVRLYLAGMRDFESWFTRTKSRAFDPALVTPLDVRSYRRYLSEERELKPRSINSYLAALRAFCGWAVDEGMAASDPTREIKSVKLVRNAPHWLSRQEQYKVLNAAQELVQLGELKAGDNPRATSRMRARRDYALIVLMLNTGLRLSEVAGLRVEDITIRPRSGTVEVRKGKGRKARTVPLNKDARKALTEWLEVRPTEDTKALFISQKSGGMSGRAIARRVEKIGQRAGVEITPHMLRHSLAKNLVDENVPLDRVGQALGHSSLDTTRQYTMPSEEDMQVALEKVSWSD